MSLSPDEVVELQYSVEKMRSASEVFKALSGRTGNEPFTHLQELANEYINLCEESLATGRHFVRDGASPIQRDRARRIKERLLALFGQELFTLR